MVEIIKNPVVILSFLSALGFFASAILVVKKSRTVPLNLDLKAPLLITVLLYGFIVSSNFLEHSGITDFFDPLEDIAEIVFTLIFLFFVHNWRKQKSFEIIRNQEIWLRSTLESIADGILTTDRNGNILQMNQAMEKYTGWQTHEVSGTPADDLLVFVDKNTKEQVDYNPFERVMRGDRGHLYPQGIFLESRDKTLTLVADSTAPIIGPDQDSLGTVGIFRDMTIYESLTIQLAHTHKMEAIGQLAGGIAHDLNNMLGGIMGAADVMKNRLVKEENQTHDKMLSIIRGAAENARDLTANLLAFSRKSKIQSAPICIREVIEKTMALAERTIDKRITFKVEYPDENYMAEGDSSQLQNAFLNLVLNAGDAMPSGGTIRITAEKILLDENGCRMWDLNIPPGSYILVEVADTGSGVPLKDQAKIFEPFFTTKEEGKGTGLGLSAVYKTMIKHNGAISMTSTPGEGTCFFMYFPALETD